MTPEQQIAEIKREMAIVVTKVDNLDTICKKMDVYASKYTSFLDMMIERELDDKEFRKMLRDKLASGGAWAAVTFVCIACYHYAKTILR